MRFYRGLSLVLYLVGMALWFAAPPGMQAQEQEGRTWTVCPEGCDFASIQEAIDLATDGDVIRVRGGGYRENVTILKAIILERIGDDPVVISPKDYEQPTLRIRRPDVKGVPTTLEGVVVRGLEIRSGFLPGSPQSGDAVSIEDAGVLFEGNRLLEGNGIRAFAFGGTGIILKENEILGRGALGILLLGNGPITVVGNRVEDKSWGLMVGGLARVELRKNLLQNNQQGLIIGGFGRTLGEENQILFNIIGVVLSGKTPEVELNRNAIARNIRWGLVLNQPPCVENASPELTFNGTLQGRDNVMFDNGNGNLCPEDYSWPEGFVKSAE
jgi:nitrous oxidase accessory protein NosD